VTTALTARRLNRATLVRQLLLRREPLGVVEAVRRLVGLQAQEAPSPYLALWNRVAGFDPAELDTAFTSGAIVKATLMRITLHAVAAEDHPVFRAVMLPSLYAARLTDRRFTSTGLSIADAEALVPHVLECAAQPRTNADMETMLARRLDATPPRYVWWALRSVAPVRHAPTGGPWSFGPRPCYVAGSDRSVDRGEALSILIRRYLAAFGPASASDLAQFSFLTRATAGAALRAMAGELRTYEGPDGVELYDVPGAPLPDEDTPAPPRLMAMWDSTLLAYADRSRVIPPGYRKLVIRNNGNVLPTLLVDGLVAGVWRPVDGGIQATAFHPLPEGTWEELAVEAAALVAFLADREPNVYGRYAHWWATLPAAQTRVLSG
jgi:Winged helix DNA-binding domain